MGLGASTDKPKFPQPVKLTARWALQEIEAFEQEARTARGKFISARACLAPYSRPFHLVSLIRFWGRAVSCPMRDEV